AERNRREFERESACRPYSALDCFGNLPQVSVTVVQLAPGVADSDDGLAVEYVALETFRPKPGAPGKIVILGALEPLTAAEAFFGAHDLPIQRLAEHCNMVASANED